MKIISGKIHCAAKFIDSLLLLMVLALPLHNPVYAEEERSALGIMEEVVKRHEHYPYTYETQSMVLTDSAGHHDVRKLRRFSRVEADGTLNYLLVFDQPAEVRGVALLATRHADGEIDNFLFLPAYGPEMKSGSGESHSTPFLGTDFTVRDLTPEITSEFEYQREADREIDEIKHLIITARPKSLDVERNTGYSLRRLFIRQDNLFIVRTDYFDRRGRLIKRSSGHDLKQVDGPMWRANMLLMEDLREGHKSLIKVNQRVFSLDYVPAEIFTPEWILANANTAPAQPDVTPESGPAPSVTQQEAGNAPAP